MSKIVPEAQELIDLDLSVRERFALEVNHAWQGECRLSATIDEGWLNGAGFLHGVVAILLRSSSD